MVERIERKPLIAEVKKVEPVRFSDEAREWLEKEAYLIYTLTGQSIKLLKKTGHRFWTDATWHQDYHEIESMQSRRSEVAIQPDKLFFPKSNSVRGGNRISRIAKMSADLSQQVPDIRTIIGELPDYAEAFFSHLLTTGQSLFGKNYARSITPIEPAGGGNMRFNYYVCIIGNFTDKNGLDIRYQDSGSNHHLVWTVPLIVPAETR